MDGMRPYGGHPREDSTVEREREAEGRSGDRVKFHFHFLHAERVKVYFLSEDVRGILGICSNSSGFPYRDVRTT